MWFKLILNFVSILCSFLFRSRFQYTVWKFLAFLEKNRLTNNVKRKRHEKYFRGRSTASTAADVSSIINYKLCRLSLRIGATKELFSPSYIQSIKVSILQVDNSLQDFVLMQLRIKKPVYYLTIKIILRHRKNWMTFFLWIKLIVRLS